VISRFIKLGVNLDPELASELGNSRASMPVRFRRTYYHGNHSDDRWHSLIGLFCPVILNFPP